MIDELPEWFLDIQRAKDEMAYGRIPLELVIANNRVAKVVGTKSEQVKFQTHAQDQKGARLWVLDILNTLEGDGTATFSVVHQRDTIKQINVFKQLEYKYPI